MIRSRNLPGQPFKHRAVLFSQFLRNGFDPFLTDADFSLCRRWLLFHEVAILVTRYTPLNPSTSISLVSLLEFFNELPSDRAEAK